MIAQVIGQMIVSAITSTILARRAAKRQSPTADAGARSRSASRTTARPRIATARQTAAHRRARRAALWDSRQSSYQALLASGDVLPIPGAHWLSDQAVVCASGHQSTFGVLATLPGYGTFAHIPDFQERGPRRLVTALREWRGTAVHPINERDPERDGRWQVACPTCGTHRYTFVLEKLREYTMCTASADLFWVPCHLHRRSGGCPNCIIRRIYWDGLRDLE